jgi:hypothetical protein
MGCNLQKKKKEELNTDDEIFLSNAKLSPTLVSQLGPKKIDIIIEEV